MSRNEIIRFTIFNVSMLLVTGHFIFYSAIILDDFVLFTLSIFLFVYAFVLIPLSLLSIREIEK